MENSPNISVMFVKEIMNNKRGCLQMLNEYINYMEKIKKEKDYIKDKEAYKDQFKPEHLVLTTLFYYDYRGQEFVEKALKIMEKNYPHINCFDESQVLPFLTEPLVPLTPLGMVFLKKELEHFFDYFLEKTNLEKNAYLSICMDFITNKDDKKLEERCSIIFKKMIDHINKNSFSLTRKMNFLYQPDQYGESAFFKTVSKGREQEFNLIWDNTPPKNKVVFFEKTRYQYKNSALHVTANRGYHGILKSLLKFINKPEFINEQNEKGSTPLYHAIFENQIECAYSLLKIKGIDPTIQTYENHVSCLHLIAAKKDEPSIKLLKEMLKFSDNIDKKNIVGATPFLYAVHGVSIVSMICLMEKNADITLPLYNEKNFLHVIIGPEHEYLEVKKIIEAIHAYSEKTWTSKKIEGIFSKLINQKDIFDMTPLDAIILNEKEELLELYLKYFYAYITKETVLNALKRLISAQKSNILAQHLKKYLQHLCDENINCLLDDFIGGLEKNYVIIDPEKRTVIYKPSQKTFMAWISAFESIEISLKESEDCKPLTPTACQLPALEEKGSSAVVLPVVQPEQIAVPEPEETGAHATETVKTVEVFQPTECLPPLSSKLEKTPLPELTPSPAEIHAFFQKIKKENQEKINHMQDRHGDFVSAITLQSYLKLSFQKNGKEKNYMCSAGHGDVTHTEDGALVCTHTNGDHVQIIRFFLIHKDCKLIPMMQDDFLKGIFMDGLHIDNKSGSVLKPKGLWDMRLFTNKVFVSENIEPDRKTMYKFYIFQKAEGHEYYPIWAKGKKSKKEMVVTRINKKTMTPRPQAPIPVLPEENAAVGSGRARIQCSK